MHKLGLALLALLTACSRPPDPKPIRDVRPTTVEIDEKLTVETSVPVEPGAPTEVELAGSFTRPGSAPVVRTLRFASARAVALAGQSTSRRVLADVDSHLEEQVGGHAAFHGKVTVYQAGQPVASACCFDVDLFPKTLRKLAHRLTGAKGAADLMSWLGVGLQTVAQPDGKSALAVTTVRRAFHGSQFIATYDCGVWDAAAHECHAPLDGRVARGEALARGVTPALFAEIDVDHDGAVDRLEAQRSDREDSPAAGAGVLAGDLLVAAGGRDVSSPDDLAAAWRSGGSSVSVGLLRAGQPLTLSLPHYGRPSSIPDSFIFAAVMAAVALLFVMLAPLLGGLVVVWERKLAGRMQSRPGPNRVGPAGWLQFLADGVKLILKEDIQPRDADPILFRLSPYLVFMGVFATFVVIPISQVAIVADLNVGVLYLAAVTSLVVVGILMGGWASNSKWSLLGGMRSAAQIISYELPASVAVLSIVTLSGTLSTQGLVLNQGGAPWNWHMFDNPFAFVCFFIYFLAALAEGNRTPFDLPEAESELVAGYNTEYSGFRFAIYFLAEWVNLIVIGAVATTVFLGGWRIPHVSPGAVEVSLVLQLLAAAIFVVKTMLLIFVIIWIRWTLPRFRVDQMMGMCWRYLLPISLASFVATAGWMWVAPYPSPLRIGVRLATFAVCGLGTLFLFAKRVNRTRKATSVLELRGA